MGLLSVARPAYNVWVSSVCSAVVCSAPPTAAPGRVPWWQGGPRHIQQKQWEGSDSDSDEGGGKLRRLQQQRLQGAAAPAGKQPAGKVLNRSQLLQVPVEQLSKWQRKRRNQKAKKQQQQQGQ